MYSRKYDPEILYNQAMKSWVVRSNLNRHIARIRGMGTRLSAHELYLKLSWVEAAVYSVYTGYVFLDKDLKMRFGNHVRYLESEGYQELTWGHDPFYNPSRHQHRTRMNTGYGLGQTLFEIVCDYEKVSRTVSNAIDAYGAGMIQYSTAQQLSPEQQSATQQQFQQNGTATLAFTDLETKVSIHQLKFDWEGIRFEAEEKRLAIESMLWGSDTRKSATLVADAEQSESINGQVAQIFDQQVIKAAKRLFGIDIEFVEKVDSLSDLATLSQSSVVTDKAVEEVTGESDFSNNDS